jgi:1-aminocyclopropane-1-carboxylate deaminase
MNTFYEQYQIPLDPVYTGKMLFAIFDLIKKKQWRWGKHILAIHTGGLQGVSGMNRQLQKKKLPVLNYQKFLP